MNVKPAFQGGRDLQDTLYFCSFFMHLVIGRIAVRAVDGRESCLPALAFNWTSILKNDNSNQINCF
jgi:hypothetical protein